MTMNMVRTIIFIAMCALPTWASFQIPNGSVSSIKRADNIVAKTTTYTATSTDEVIEVSGSSFTLTLPNPAAGNSGKRYEVVKIDSALGNVISVTSASASIISGTNAYTTVTLNTQAEAWVFRSDGTYWWVVSHRANTQPTIYTPTLSNFTGSGSVNIYSWRSGSMLKIMGQFTCGNSSAAGASMTIGFQGANAPSGLAITNQGGVQQKVGSWTPPGIISGWLSTLNSTTVLSFIQSFTSGASQSQTTNANQVCSNTQVVSIQAEMQISGWFE